MKIKFSHSVFVFMCEGKKHSVMFEPTDRPAGIVTGQYYSVHVFQEGNKIGGFKTDQFANKSNAKQLLEQLLNEPF